MYEDETSRACRWHLPAAHFWNLGSGNRTAAAGLLPPARHSSPVRGIFCGRSAFQAAFPPKGTSSRQTIRPHLSPFTTGRANVFERRESEALRLRPGHRALQHSYSEEAYPPLSRREKQPSGTAMEQRPLLPPATAEADWKTAAAGTAILPGLFHRGLPLEAQRLDAGMPGPVTGVSAGRHHAGFPRHLPAAGRRGFLPGGK